ncbi:calcium/proton exchanger [Fodinisporobacter ferrooxydans]|uniref:Ca(2+)/H(+) antiporter n=1 Tax=Fodinisporobacter ferrooxydans TaxID=2901836 RepID=A0ABY4CLE2_9BACL|nr:calcium/proton exchanger [Alicyclobacillaceae bacterium MYW30-H2]
MNRILNLLLFILLPVSIAAAWLGVSDTILFILSCAVIIPLAGIMGRATESIAIHSGPRLGGLLNATFGNAVELIISFFALKAGLTSVVQASITGSIIGNLLLVAGLSFFVGGIKYPTQSFNRTIAGTNASMMVLGVIVALVIPSIFTFKKPEIAHALSITVAIISLLLYILGLLFSLFTHKQLLNYTEDMEHEDAEWSLSKAIGILCGATIAVGFESEFLVKSIEHVSHVFGWSQMFIGVIVVAIVGNAAEHSSAVFMAWKNRMDISLEIAVGSSLQVAMFVTPVLIFLSFLVGHPMSFVFAVPETVSMILSVFLITYLSLDGESNWLEGAMAVGAYIIIATGFYFV